MDLSYNLTNIHTNEEVYNAKQYMASYKSLLDDYNLEIGLIGRFFEKLFGTQKYTNIEIYLNELYGMSYYEVMTILYDTHQEKYIFDPFK